MKKKYAILFIIVLICITILALLLCNNKEIYLHIGNIMPNDMNSKIYTISSEKNVYSYFDNVKIEYNKKEFTLSEALENKTISIDDILKKNNKVDSLNDGGTKIYYFKKNNMFNKDFLIVDCNSLSGNKNIYIMENFDFKNSVCK